jgi:NAD(P)-dependent dehydrogenase (short-subunit alcohol dehydrogenase family)
MGSCPNLKSDERRVVQALSFRGVLWQRDYPVAAHRLVIDALVLVCERDSQTDPSSPMGDVANLADLDRLYKTVADEKGAVDIVVTNAGFVEQCSARHGDA